MNRWEVIFATEIMKTKLVLILDNIRSAYNVGTILRSAVNLGITKVVMTGITPLPTHPKVVKTALIRGEMLEWEHQCETGAAVSYYQKLNYDLAVLEIAANAISLVDVKFPTKTVLVLGNEVTGVKTELRLKAQIVIQVPTSVKKLSMNVAVAGSLAMYEWRRQCESKLMNANINYESIY